MPKMQVFFWLKPTQNHPDLYYFTIPVRRHKKWVQTEICTHFLDFLLAATAVSAAAATAAAVTAPSSAAIAVAAAAEQDDDQNDDPQTTAAIVIPAPHIEYLPQL